MFYYCFEKIVYDNSLINGEYQSSFLFSFLDEIKDALEKKANLIGALSLFCLIEIAGREALNFINPEKKKTGTDCFNYFLDHYMNYGELLRIQPKLYDLVRNGMVHNGFPKFDLGVTLGTGYTDQMLTNLGFNHENIRGLIITKDDVHIILDQLLLEFMNGLVLFRSDEIRNNWKYE